MNAQKRRYFIYAAKSLMSLRDLEWRIISRFSGWEERDVAINSVPFDLRTPGRLVWVIWDARHDCLSRVLPRSREDPTDLPEPWSREYEEQTRLIALGRLELDRPIWLASGQSREVEYDLTWDPVFPPLSPEDLREVAVEVVFGSAGPTKSEVLAMKRFVPSLREMETPKVYKLLKGQQNYALGSFPQYLTESMIEEANGLQLDLRVAEVGT